MDECPQRPPELELVSQSVRKIARRMDDLEKAHDEDRAKLNQQIQQLQKENASIQDEKVKLTREMEQLKRQSQQGWFC